MRKNVFSLAVILLALGSIVPTMWDIFARDWLEQSVRSGDASLEELVRGMGHPAPSVRRLAVDVLGQRVELSDTEIRPLVEALERPDLSGHAANSLAKIGGAAVPALIEAMSHESPWRRREAAVVLGRIGRPASSAVEVLIAAMTTDKDGNVRYRSAEALGKVGEASEELVSAIRGAMSDENYRVRIEAAHALGRLNPDADVLVQTLRKSLVDDPHPRVRREVAVVLGDRGAEAAAAVPELVAAHVKVVSFQGGRRSLSLQSRDGDKEYFNNEFDKALFQMGLAAVPALLRAMNKNPRLRYLETSLSRALRALDDKNPLVRDEAASSLKRVFQSTRDSKDALALLIRALESKSALARKTAVSVLGIIGPDAQSAIPAILKAASQHKDLRGAAAAAVKKIQPTD